MCVERRLLTREIMSFNSTSFLSLVCVYVDEETIEGAVELLNLLLGYVSTSSKRYK